MVTVSVAMLKVMEEQGFRPDVTAGLSLGEYCAPGSFRRYDSGGRHP